VASSPDTIRPSPHGIAGQYRAVVHSPGYFDSTEGTGEASRGASPREAQRAGKYRVARFSPVFRIFLDPKAIPSGFIQ
jgi:hypothetical protein